jgi:hypothetical protein
VAGHENGLQVLDISDPVNPRRAGGCDTSGSAYNVAVVGNFVYVVDRWGLLILEQSLAQAPPAQ